MPWAVYILKCSDNSYYVGHTKNLEYRLKLHSSGRGAKHTATRRPVVLKYQESTSSKQEAIKREKQIKGWSRLKKEALIQGDMEHLSKLSHSRSTS
jgi:predicted GIY-YIG superfamily endonuclease